MLQDLIAKIVSVVNQETLGMYCHGQTCIITTVPAQASMKITRRLGAKGSYLTLVRVADRIL